MIDGAVVALAAGGFDMLVMIAGPGSEPIFLLLQSERIHPAQRPG